MVSMFGQPEHQAKNEELHYKPPYLTNVNENLTMPLIKQTLKTTKSLTHKQSDKTVNMISIMRIKRSASK